MVRRSTGKIWRGYFPLRIRCPRSMRTGNESLFWEARIYRYCTCGGRSRKCHPQPSEAHIHKIEKLRECLARGCSFCAGFCSGICAGGIRRAMLLVPCGSAEELSVKKIAEAAAMRCAAYGKCG